MARPIGNVEQLPVTTPRSATGPPQFTTTMVTTTITARTMATTRTTTRLSTTSTSTQRPIVTAPSLNRNTSIMITAMPITTKSLTTTPMSRMMPVMTTSITTTSITTTSGPRMTTSLTTMATSLPTMTTSLPTMTTSLPTMTTSLPIMTTSFMAVTTAPMPTIITPTDLNLTKSNTTKLSFTLTKKHFLNETSEDFSLKKTPIQSALSIAQHIENVQMIFFSVAGFFVTVFLGFVSYELFVACKFCQKLKKKSEPIYATIPKKSLTKKPLKTDNIQSVANFEPRPISPTLPVLSFVDRLSKLEFFFSQKKNSTAHDNLTNVVTNESTETAKVHKPYVLCPSFVFGEMPVEVNETFSNIAPLQTVSIERSGLDLKNVVVSYTNENYVPPSSLPKLPPLHFQTFKRPNRKKSIDNVIESNFDSIELAPDQANVDNSLM